MKPTLRTYATEGLVVISWAATLTSAFDLMNTQNVRHLPVVHDDGTIIGILSERDIQRAMHVENADFFSPKAPQASIDPISLVRDFMSWPVHTIESTRPVAEAAKVMIEKKISSLLVVSGGTVTGIVTSEDLLRALVDEYEDTTTPTTTRHSSDFETAIYTSPVGSIAQVLANAGV